MSTKLAMAAIKMRAAYVDGWENILTRRPDLEHTQQRMLDPDYMRRFFTHIESRGVIDCDLDHLSFRLMAAGLGVHNTQTGWKLFIEGAPKGGALF